MTKEEVKKRIEKLRKAINHHRYLYHVLDTQEISDSALDSLKKELQKLEKENPEFIIPYSPTQRVGGKPLKGFEKVKHRVPMLSIEDIFSEKELFDWEDYLKRLMPEVKFNYFCEPKIDGFAISLIYEKGVFEIGSTRGDGKIGEDVTQNLKTIESIPLNLELHGKLPSSEIEKKAVDFLNDGRIEVRGEVYMEKRDFDDLNKELDKKGQKTYANPRNLAAGSIRQLDPKLAAFRPLKFLAYDLVTDFGQKKHSEEHRILKAFGFKTEAGKECGKLSEVLDFWKEIAEKREKLPFQIDGVVVIVNNNVFFQKLGVVGKSPRGIRAFKFSPKQATTKIKNIKVQVGRTGAITPIALLEPVGVGGVVVSRATLHNEDEIKRLGVKIGDTVIVERAGDVIPAVVKVLKDLRTRKESNFRMPRNCPVCGKKLLRSKKEVVLRCRNINCGAQKRELIYHFVSKKAFNIDGLGPKIIDRLLDENLISQTPEIFELKEGDLIPLERFAEKSAENLIKSIQESKKIPLFRFIYSLGIRHVGEETSFSLSQYFGSLRTLKKASKEDLERVPDIGNVVAKSIYDWLKSKRNQKFINDLLKAGVSVIDQKKVSQKLKGKSFVLTGTLEKLTRDEARKRIRMLGGNPSDSVSEKTDYLVIGKNPGSKLEKAKSVGIKIIQEKDFLDIIKE
ncbi:MAG: NAD-dependent DNA ligase LigA [Candidatus Nealsonbacteria bacterium]